MAIVAAVMATLLAGYSATAAPAERRLLFLVDRSGSMPWDKDPATHKVRQFSFSDAMAGARRRARDIVSGHLGRTDVLVSFWQFGEKDRQAAIDDAIGLPPGEALGRIDGAFSDDASLYRASRSYIAYSIFQIVKRELGLSQSFGPDSDIPEDASLFDICVVTDGEENVRDKRENQRYIDWVERQQRRLRLRWDRCDVYIPPPPEICTGGVDEDLDGRADCDDPDCETHPSCTTPPPDHVVYEVLFGLPTLAATYDPRLASDGRPVALEIPRTVRLVPRGHGAGLRPEEVGSPLVCRGEATAPTPVPGPSLAVQAEIQWPDPVGATRTSEWSLGGPERGTVGQGRELRVDRASMRPHIDGETSAVLPAGEVPDGRYPVRFVREALCAELLRSYPGSTFVLPEDDDGGLLRLGDVVVARTQMCDYVVTAGQGERPSDTMGPLQTDAFHVYEQRTRQLGVSCDAACGPAKVNVRVTLLGEGGEPVPSAGSLIAVPGAPRSGVIVLPCGDAKELRLVAPAEAQRWIERAFLMGFDPPPGTHTARVCFEPALQAPPPGRYVVRVSCPDCLVAATAVDTLCIEIPLVVDSPPVFWLVWVALGIAVLLFLWLTVLWVTRPQLPSGLRIGHQLGGTDIRSVHGRGLKGARALLLRQPCYVNLQSSGQSDVTRDNFTRSEHARGMTVIGIMPGTTRSGSFCMWDASPPPGEGVAHRDVRLDADPDPLPVLHRPSRRAIQRGARLMTLDEARSGDRKLVLRITHGTGPEESIEYPITVGDGR